jgi:hypothetical protein
MGDTWQVSRRSLNFLTARTDTRCVAIKIPWRPLGRLLVERGVISEQELKQALATQSATGKRLGEVLVEGGVVSGPALTLALAEQWGIEVSPEGGFGSGLWQEIERRHRERRGTDPPDDDDVAAPAEAPPGAADREDLPVDLLRQELDDLRARLERSELRLAELEPAYAEATKDLDELRRAPVAPAIEGHVLFVQQEERYAIVDGEGVAPPVGADLELEGAPFRVWKLGRSPLPADRRLCAFLLPLVAQTAG